MADTEHEQAELVEARKRFENLMRVERAEFEDRMRHQRLEFEANMQQTAAALGMKKLPADAQAPEGAPQPLSDASAQEAAAAAAAAAPAEEKASEAPANGKPSGCSPSACETCASKGTCSSRNKDGVNPMQEVNDDIKSRLQLVDKKLIVLSGKGGVGKSMLSTQLALALASRGMLVGILDVDICGPSVAKMLGIPSDVGVMQESNGLVPVKVNDNLQAMSIAFMVDNQSEAIIWRGPRKMGLIQLFLKDVDWGVLDFLIIDTPPGTSDEHLSIVQHLKETGIDGALIVTTPQEVALHAVRKEVDFCKKMGVPITGIIENMSGFVCPLCRAESHIFQASTGGGEQLATDSHVPFLGRVPLDPLLAQSGDLGKSYFETASPVKDALLKVVDNIIANVATKPQ
eukprot:TRINITY_DN150_c0_g1_i1.p2 TRINITY_DN150_c0_g1~~TRINITY_DN150_c0_g1_i1.p2  ORF type:complete len:415 (+),score=128.83 TRINITY_DN150_c0_g1_i1:45-1247(+)